MESRRGGGHFSTLSLSGFISPMTGLELKIFSLGLKPGLALLPLLDEVRDLHKLALGLLIPLGSILGIYADRFKLSQ